MQKKLLKRDEEKKHREQAEDQEDGQERIQLDAGPNNINCPVISFPTASTTQEAGRSNDNISEPLDLSMASRASARTRPGTWQTATHAKRRRVTQHPWYQVDGPSNAGIFNSQQSQSVAPTPEFGVVGANPRWLSSRILHAGSSGGVNSSFSLSRLAEGYYSQAKSEDRPMFREGSSPYPPQQTESRGISQQPKDPSNAGSAPMRNANSKKIPKQNSQPFCCVLCERCGSRNYIGKHINRYHGYGDEMRCYEQTVVEDKAIYAPKNAVENNELASCSNCHKVLFKHRAKFGNHDCVQCRYDPAIKYQQTIDEGEGAEYCLMCQLRCGNVKEHHKIAHNGNKVYKVGVMFGKTCLAPLHLHDKNHREELMEDRADGGHHRFAYIFRARRIS